MKTLTALLLLMAACGSEPNDREPIAACDQATLGTGICQGTWCANQSIEVRHRGDQWLVYDLQNGSEILLYDCATTETDDGYELAECTSSPRPSIIASADGTSLNLTLGDIWSGTTLHCSPGSC